MKTDTLQTIATVAHKTSYAGAAGGFWGWLTSNATLGLLGLLVALCSMLINAWYKRKADLRAAAEHELLIKERQIRLELLQTEIRVEHTP